jgi:sulfite exporter TauE/SafE
MTSVFELFANPYLNSLAIGFIFGLGTCTVSCLPYIASYIASVGANFRQSIRITLIFNIGRIFSYAIIGVLIGVFGGLVRFFADEPTRFMLQNYSIIVLSVVTIIIGVSLLYKGRKTSCNCNPSPLNPKRLTNRFDVGAFTLGLSRGLILCPPLITLLVSSVLLANPLGSVTIAVLFGIGTAISPMLLIGGVTGWLLSKAPLLRNYIAIAGAVIIILLGIITLISSFLILA